MVTADRLLHSNGSVLLASGQDHAQGLLQVSGTLRAHSALAG